MSGGEPFLAFYCPKLRSDTLRSPCALNLAKAKELRQKFPNALLGPIEHCAACKGVDLVVREAPVSHLGGKTELAGGLHDDAVTPLAPDNLAATAIEVSPETKEDKDMGGVVKFKDQGEAERFLGKGKIPVDPPPRCPKHPHEPQIGCSPDGKRAGQYLGACQKCMAERRLGRKPKGTMTPAVARDLGIAPVPAPTVKPICQTPTPDPEINVHLPGLAADPSPPMCTTHNLPIKFNAKGISMGGCEVCRREIAAMGGHKAKILAAVDPLERIFADHDAELEWLVGVARDQVRTPEGHLVYLVRVAMRQEVAL
jgi:hypothetical protein